MIQLRRKGLSIAQAVLQYAERSASFDSGKKNVLQGKGGGCPVIITIEAQTKQNKRLSAALSRQEMACEFGWQQPVVPMMLLKDKRREGA